MNFSDILRSFFGLNHREYSDGQHNGFRNPIWNIDDDDDTDDELHHGFRQEGNGFPRGGSFNIFTDPLEMARYADSQMERMMSIFSGMLGEHFGGNFSLPAPPTLPPGHSILPPAIKPSDESGQRSIRDEYLKPGYSKPSNSNRVDSDIDNEITNKNMDSILDNIGKLQIDEPKTQTDSPSTQFSGSNNFYFKQIITRSITRPDGTIETTRTVRNSDGTEETTSTITQGDGRRGFPGGAPNGQDVTPFNGGFWSGF